MAERPLLLFPQPVVAERARRGGGPSDVHYPPRGRQRQRLDPKFRRLDDAFRAERASLAPELAGADPEKVLVLEVVGTVERFLAAVSHIEGLEWLAEADEYEIRPDEDFYRDEEGTKALSGQLFLLMSDHAALRQLRSLWARYKRNSSYQFPRGLAPLRSVFQQLRDIRTWDVRDRLLETGIVEDWNLRLERGQEAVRAEVELWFRRNDATRRVAAEHVRQLVLEANGNVLSEAVLEQIAYHALLMELPRQSVEIILAEPSAALVRTDHVMFFRPVGQSATPIPENVEFAVPVQTPSMEGLMESTPVVAVFDGLPLQRHENLRDRIRVDDPDGWEATYPAAQRIHGTAMTSLILHGELDSPGDPLATPLYVRPILHPEPDGMGGFNEVIPEDVLPPDLIVRAVRRLFEQIEGAAAPSVRIANFSVADIGRPFARFVSPLARALDWASWHYGVLFIVSAGNQTEEIELAISDGDLRALSGEDLEHHVIGTLARNAHLRRVLSPAEGLNVLSVGAAHSDSSHFSHLGLRINPITSSKLPSPISPLGFGFRRSVKPDVLMAGGRQTYDVRPRGSGNTGLRVNVSTSPPGQRVATPGPQPGALSHTRHDRGTSNAAALTSRIAAQAFDVVKALVGGITVPEKCWAPLLKAMVVHTASWSTALDSITNALDLTDTREARLATSRFAGYGAIDPARALSGDDHRAPLIGWGEISKDEGHIFTLPLPESLAGKREWRRLTLTLAWLSPVSASHHKYRSAALWIAPPEGALQVRPHGVDWQSSRRGTVQHEILEGDQASVFEAGTTMEVRVSCAEEAPPLDDPVPYGLAVTLEVAPETELAVYDEIAARIRPAVRIRPTESSGEE